MSGIKPTVAYLLKTYPALRSNDSKLIANVWNTEVDIENMSAKDFLSCFADKKITTPESITRMRRKLQEEFPELRGDNYIERQVEQNTVRQGINK